MLRPPLNDSTLVMNFVPVVAAPQNFLDGIGSAALYTDPSVRNVFRQIFEIQTAGRYFQVPRHGLRPPRRRTIRDAVRTD